MSPSAESAVAKRFSSSQDRVTYLRLLRENLVDARVRLLGFCLMTNHVHLIAVSEDADSLAVLLRKSRSSG
jgi:putative transposase